VPPAAAVTASAHRLVAWTPPIGNWMQLSGKHFSGSVSSTRPPRADGLGTMLGVLQRFMNHFRSTATAVLQRFGASWHYQSPAGTLMAQNDRHLWTLQTRWPDGIAPEAVDVHALLQGFAGCSVSMADHAFRFSGCPCRKLKRGSIGDVVRQEWG
jgi:hypothetical protein